MEGVKRNKVTLFPHNNEWDKEYQAVRKEIEEVWRDNLLDIQHVGSTAITNIYAKPILDVAVRLDSIEQMDSQALARHGYEYIGPQNARGSYHLFVMRSDEGLSLRHIHCYGKNEKEFFQLVGFRDYLNEHAEAAKQYEDLKKTLASDFPEDRVAYTKGKEEFIKGIYHILDFQGR